MKTIKYVSLNTVLVLDPRPTLGPRYSTLGLRYTTLGRLNMKLLDLK